MVELIQGVFLPARHASFSDIVANTAGAALGALLVALGRRVTELGDERRGLAAEILRRAFWEGPTRRGKKIY